MLISGNDNLSQIKLYLDVAHAFLLSKEDAMSICTHQKEVIEKIWPSVCDEAELNETDRKLLWKRQFLNPFSFEGLE